MDAKRERRLDEAVCVLRRRKGVQARQCHAPAAASSVKICHYSMESLLSFVRGKKKKEGPFFRSYLSQNWSLNSQYSRARNFNIELI